MKLFSTKILKGINSQFDDNKDVFDKIEDVCVNIYIADAVFRMCFIIEEDADLLSFVATDSEGREKIKVVNKQYVQSVEVNYLDDSLAMEAEEKIDDMFN